MDEDTIRVVCGECIDKAQERFVAQTCNIKHKEVEDVKSKMDKMYDRQNYVLVVLLVAALGLAANLFLKG